jgi:hypothetical protein
MNEQIAQDTSGTRETHLVQIKVMLVSIRCFGGIGRGDVVAVGSDAVFCELTKLGGDQTFSASLVSATDGLNFYTELACRF